MPVGILVLTVLLIVGLTGLDHHRLMTSQIPMTTEVPAVLGFNRAQAESVLRNAHLVPRVRLVQGTSATIRTVTDQTPAGGELAARDSTVIIEISTGPGKAKVPTGLVGGGTASAERLLVNAGFTNVITRPGPVPPTPQHGP